MAKRKSVVYFMDAQVEALSADKSLPKKLERLLKSLNLKKRVKDKSVGIKMHFGGGIGYTTIHPVFIRTLVCELKEAGAKSVKVMDFNPDDGVPRGYTREVLGCDVVSVFGATRKYMYRERIGFKTLDEAYLGGEAVDCDFFIDLSHAKGHGACGYGGAIKNIAMGVIPPETRGKLHRLEGGLQIDPEKCRYCLKCIKVCRYGALNPNKESRKVELFLHHCVFCQHCLMECPHKAFSMTRRDFGNFSKGMALVTTAFLKKFKPEDLFFINFALNITAYCDCWGFSSAPLHPDVGIFASEDIAAVEQATLDSIRNENFIPAGLPRDRKLVSDTGRHLFERIHGKDPCSMIRFMEELYDCSAVYSLKEVR